MIEHIVSQNQRHILRHALGLPVSYRNYFCTGKGSDDYTDCEALVAAGMMTLYERSWIPDCIYTVTEQGRKVAA